MPNLDARSIMVTIPKTLSRRVSVHAVREAFEDDHVHMLLLTEGRVLLGTLVRSDIPAPCDMDEPALRFARLENRTVAPDVSVADVHALLRATGLRRLAVVDDEGVLLGLVCLKRDGSGFCSDAGVLARQAERLAQPGSIGAEPDDKPHGPCRRCDDDRRRRFG